MRIYSDSDNIFIIILHEHFFLSCTYTCFNLQELVYPNVTAEEEVILTTPDPETTVHAGYQDSPGCVSEGHTWGDGRGGSSRAIAESVEDGRRQVISLC